MTRWKAAAELASRYVADRFLPDKAIDLVDEAASRVRIKKSSTPPSLKEAMRGLEGLRKEKDAAISQQQYEYAAELRDREVKLQDKIEKMEQGWETERDESKPTVGEEDIAEVVSMWTGIPLARIASEEFGATAVDGESTPAQQSHWPGRGDHCHREGGAPRPRGPE